jgi:hypothetical protein
MTFLDAFQIVLIGASSGFGSTFGVEMAKYVIERLRARKR